MPIRVNARRSPVLQRHATQVPAPPGQGALAFGLPTPDSTIPQLPAGISLCMIVKNEERFLEACLASARAHVDEICIVDTGSADRTIAIAESFGARIERRDWRNDFAWARNEALAMATRRWILVLDADEVIRPESHEPLRALRTIPAATTGLWVRCFNVVDDYKGTGASSHAIARVFPNSPRIRYRSPIHEFITVDGRDTGMDAKHAPLAIDHYGYLNAIVAERKKGDRNLAIIRAAVADHPDDPFHWYNLGTTALIERKIEEGIVALEKMFALIGTEPRGFVPSALSFLADAYIEYRGDAARGEALARESLKRSPRFSNAHFTLGKALMAQGRATEAVAAYKAAIDAGKYNREQFLVDDEVSVWKAQSEIGAVYGKLGERIEALAWFDRALANRPGVLPLMLNRARALESLQRYEDTAAQFREAWESFQDDQTATELVNFLLRRHQYFEAVEQIEAIAPLVSTRCAALQIMTAAAIVERVPGREAEGPSYARRALALMPGAAPVLDAAEKYFGERGDAAAVAALRAAELDAPLETVEDYARRSSRWLGEGRPDRTVAVAQAGRERFGDQPGLLYDEAAGTVQLGDRGGALRLLDQVSIESAQVYGKAAFLRSVILADLGRFDAAVESIDTVLDIAPGNPEAVLHRAKLLASAGRMNEIESTLRAGLDGGDGRVAAELSGLLMREGRFPEALAIADSALNENGASLNFLA